MGGLKKLVKKGLGEMGFNAGGGAINWFPGHMAAATRAIRDRLKLADLVVEVRDARIPLSSANQDLQPQLSAKRPLIALNKKDLPNPNIMPVIIYFYLFMYLVFWVDLILAFYWVLFICFWRTNGFIISIRASKNVFL